MSVYWVAMWTVQSGRLVDHDAQALPALLQHVRSDHPRVLSARTWAILWGSNPARPGRIWIEEFASLTSVDDLDREEMGPACDAVWQAIHELSVPGTFRTAIWTDSLRDAWKEPNS